MFAYTKKILESVSFDPKLFCKELEKAIRQLLPYEIDQLRDWLLNFTKEKPELKSCLIYLICNLFLGIGQSLFFNLITFLTLVKCNLSSTLNKLTLT